MHSEDLLAIKQQQPFRPFRIFVRYGKEYEVRHPGLIIIGRRSVVIGISEDPWSAIYVRSVEVALFDITRIEQMEERGQDS